MDTPLQPQSIPMLTPSGGVDADEKQMKITKLEQEIFTVVKQSDELKRQLTDSLKTSTLLREQVASLEADKLDRAKFVQSLERSRDELIVERTELQNARVLLQSQKDHSEGEAAKFLNEKRRLGEELIASREECANAKKELCLAQMQADEVNSEKRLIAYEKERWSREKEILLQGKQWCMREITDRETKLSELRIQLNQMEMRLQQERAVIVGEKEELSSRAEELQETLTKRDAELAELRERVQQMIDERTTAMNEMDAELRAKERLTDVYKQSLDAATNEIAALKESESRLHSRLDEVDGEMGEVQGELERLTATNRTELEERDGRIDRLEDELKKANELLQAGTTGRLLHSSEEELAALSPAAAAAVSLLKSGHSLTSIYAEHCRVVSELEKKSAECQRIERYVTELIDELDAKAPLFKEQSELYEKSQEEIETLRLQNELLAQERQKLTEAKDALARELTFTNKELERYQRDHQTLKQQVRRLLFVAAKGESPNASMRDDSAEDEDDYILFTNINELHQRNVELLSRIKQMEAEQEEQLESQRSVEQEQLANSLHSTQQELHRLRDHISRQDLVLTEVTAQRDNYKKLYAETMASVAGAGTTNADENEGVQLAAKVARGRQSLEMAESELQHAQKKVEFLQEKLDYFADDKQRLEKALNDRVDQLMEQVAQLRTTNGKLESDLEFQKKNQKLYAKQLDEAESESKKQAGSAQKAKSQLDALQARFDQLSAQLIEQQGELSRLKVANHSLGEQLNIARSNEQRTTTELGILRDSRYNAERVAVALQEVEALLKRVDAERESSMQSQLQSAQLERDNLKQLVENVNRQHTQFSNTLKMQLNQLTAERDKALLDAKALREELSGAETKLRELKEEFDRVTTASVEIPAADTSLESCKKEVQQLKNKLTYQEKQLAEWKSKCEELTMSVERKERELDEIQSLSSGMESAMKQQSELSTVEGIRLQARSQQLEEDLARVNDSRQALRLQVSKLEVDVVTREREIERAEVIVQELKAALQKANDDGEQERRSQQEVVEQLQQTVENLQGEAEKVSSQLSTITAEKDSLKEALNEQTDRYAVLEKEASSLKEASQVEIQSLRASLELKEMERLNNINEIAGLQQRDRENGDRVQELYGEIQKLVEQISLMEQMNSSGGGAGSLLDISSASQSGTTAADGTGSFAMERLNTIIGYMREEKQKEMELRMNAELELQRQRAKCQLADERTSKMEHELQQAKQIAEANRQAASEKEHLVGQLELLKQTQQRYTELRKQTEELSRRFVASDAKSKEAEASLLQSSRENATLKRSVETLQKEVEQRKNESLVLRKRNEHATALAARYSPEKYTTLMGEFEKAKQASAAQSKEIEALRAQVSAGASQTAVAKLRVEVEEKNKLLLQTRAVGKNYRDKFNAKESEVATLRGEITQLQQQLQQVQQQQAAPAAAGGAKGRMTAGPGGAMAAAAIAAASGIPIVNPGPKQRAVDAAEIEALKGKIAEAEKAKSELESKIKSIVAERDEAVEKNFRLDTITSALTQKEKRIKALEERLTHADQQREKFIAELDAERAAKEEKEQRLQQLQQLVDERSPTADEPQQQQVESTTAPPQPSRKRAGSSDLLAEPTLSDLGQPDEKRSRPSPPQAQVTVIVEDEPSHPQQEPTSTPDVPTEQQLLPPVVEEPMTEGGEDNLGIGSGDEDTGASTGGLAVLSPMDEGSAGIVSEEPSAMDEGIQAEVEAEASAAAALNEPEPLQLEDQPADEEGMEGQPQGPEEPEDQPEELGDDSGEEEFEEEEEEEVGEEYGEEEAAEDEEYEDEYVGDEGDGNDDDEEEEPSYEQPTDRQPGEEEVITLSDDEDEDAGAGDKPAEQGATDGNGKEQPETTAAGDTAGLGGSGEEEEAIPPELQDLLEEEEEPQQSTEAVASTSGADQSAATPAASAGPPQTLEGKEEETAGAQDEGEKKGEEQHE